MHDEHEQPGVVTEKRMKTEEAQKRYKVRAHKGETPFAVIKACFNMRRFLLRGIEGVRQEWRWASTAFNLHRLILMMRRNQACISKFKSRWQR